MSDTPPRSSPFIDNDLTTSNRVSAEWLNAVDVIAGKFANLSYAGNSLKTIRVNVGETAFELATQSTGLDVIQAQVFT